MRESVFVRQNHEKWKGYESNQTLDPDSIAASFIELSNDLSFAKTFYPRSRIIPYLNELTGRFYQRIYRNKKERKSRFITFWKIQLPETMYACRRQLLYAFLFFIVFCFIGALSAANDPTFINLVLGNDYVNTTNENIAKGDPFHVYKSEGSLVMFLGIALNNITVSFMMFVKGIFFTVGSVWSIFENGLMLGSFQYFFFSKGLGWSSVLVIWIHGTLEIAALVVSGCAGITLGNSLLFPGTYTRLESLRMGASKGLKMIIGLVPVFITAAFLESFVTRHDHMPRPVSISVLAFSLLFILWYFVFYPAQLYRRKSF